MNVLWHEWRGARATGRTHALPQVPSISEAEVQSHVVLGMLSAAPPTVTDLSMPALRSNVTINTRMTVIRLSSGGLWVHAPIAPTQECLEMVRSLGEVEHIVLPTFAIEHKVFFGPFARNFPNASLWVAPKQWSFPLNLPLSFLGLGFRSVQELSDDLTPEECSWRQGE